MITLLTSLSWAAKEPPDKDEVFSLAVDRLQKERFDDAANAAWSFIQVSTDEDPRFDRAHRLIAQSAESMGLVYSAAVMYRDIAKSRRNVELLPDALLSLERIVKAGTYDEDQLLTSFVASEDFGTLQPTVQPFVDFHKGLSLSRRGMDGWADTYFARLEPSSEYGARATYVRAVQQVADGEFGDAIGTLEELKAADYTTPDLLIDVERSLARIAFDELRYDDALVHFGALAALAPDDPEILLETAWTHYYMGDSRKALGLLVALDAPVHEEYIAPERYLLEALALRRLCQFGAARQAAVHLERRYEDSLKALGSGKLPADIPEMRAAARLRGQSLPNSKLREQLRWESKLLRQSSLSGDLKKHLRAMYKRGTTEADRRENERIDADLEQLTQELLAAQEGVRLIVHELGVSMLRGRRRPGGVVEKPYEDIPVGGDYVFYEFSGEFWTDELDDLVVVAEDRCVD